MANAETLDIMLDKLITTRRIGNDLLKKFGLTDWRFEFMSRSATSLYGECDPSKKVIRLSPVLTEMNPLSESELMIRHEIAHARTTGGHDKEFYAMCIKVGARPQRCYPRTVMNKSRNGRRQTMAHVASRTRSNQNIKRQWRGEHEVVGSAYWLTEYLDGSLRYSWFTEVGKPRMICFDCWKPSCDCNDTRKFMSTPGSHVDNKNYKSFNLFEIDHPNWEVELKKH